MKDELGDEIDLLATGLFLGHQEVYRKVPIKAIFILFREWTDKFYSLTGTQGLLLHRHSLFSFATREQHQRYG